MCRPLYLICLRLFVDSFHDVWVVLPSYLTRSRRGNVGSEGNGILNRVTVDTVPSNFNCGHVGTSNLPDPSLRVCRKCRKKKEWDRYGSGMILIRTWTTFVGIVSFRSEESGTNSGELLQFNGFFEICTWEDIRSVIKHRWLEDLTPITITSTRHSYFTCGPHVLNHTFLYNFGVIIL